MARRRGQAALEFLSTYGFAFLLILLMIAALSYFGVLSPAKYLPGRCLVSSEFRCDDRILKLNTPATMDVKMTLTNQLGNTIIVSAGTASSTISAPGPVCTSVPALGTPITSGQQFVITCPLTPSAAAFPAAGEKAKVSFELTYQELGGSFNRKALGEVADTIQ